MMEKVKKKSVVLTKTRDSPKVRHHSECDTRRIDIFDLLCFCFVFVLFFLSYYKFVT